ncbi:MAG: glycoside hydrolase family 2 TIM barrel-domain containing protein [candidate division FCPU426 bacterium]
MNARLSLILLFLSVIPLSASPLIQNPGGRDVTSLNGTWKIIVDPYETGYFDYRHQESAWGYGQDAKPKNKQELLEYDFDRSPSLQVPGDWNSQREDLKYYEGTLWYRKAFEATPKAGKRYFLRFDAANYEAKVWLNGAKLGDHRGGFTPFEFEVSGILKTGRNSVVVKVDNRRHEEAVPTVNTDWWNYGGLTRDVTLIETEATFIRDYAVTLGKDAGTVEAWALLDGPAASGMPVSLKVDGWRAEGRADQTGLVRLLMNADPARWTPEDPRLIDVTLAAGGTSGIHDRIGFRKIETKGVDILLNGKPVFLRGICLHEEPISEKGGRIQNAVQDRELLALAKDLGCNFVRLAHYPHNEAMLREADRLGLMVWAEVPVYWTIQWENAATFENAKSQLEAMIQRDKNRASVVIWSVGNETPRGDARLKFMNGLVDAARSLDTTRLISAALEQSGDLERRVDDPLGHKLDVLGLNEYVGWYDGAPDKCRRVSYSSALEKPLIISEFGGDAKQGLHGPKEERWNEEYQAWIYEEQLPMLDKISNLRGMTPWILKDFRSPRRPLPGIQDGWNRKGLVSNLGKKKKAFAVLKKYYEAKAKTTPSR